MGVDEVGGVFGRGSRRGVHIITPEQLVSSPLCANTPH